MKPLIFNKENVNKKAKKMHNISLDRGNPDFIIIGKYGIDKTTPTIVIPVMNAWVTKLEHSTKISFRTIQATIQNNNLEFMYVKTGDTYDVFNIHNIVYKTPQQGGVVEFKAFKIENGKSVPYQGTLIWQNGYFSTPDIHKTKTKTKKSTNKTGNVTYFKSRIDPNMEVKQWELCMMALDKYHSLGIENPKNIYAPIPELNQETVSQIKKAWMEIKRTFIANSTTNVIDYISKINGKPSVELKAISDPKVINFTEKEKVFPHKVNKMTRSKEEDPDKPPVINIKPPWHLVCPILPMRSICNSQCEALWWKEKTMAKEKKSEMTMAEMENGTFNKKIARSIEKRKEREQHEKAHKT